VERDTMRITFSRSGGVAGVRLRTTVSEDDLSAPHAAKLRRLVKAAECFRLPQQLAADPKQPDRFQYELTLEDGGQRHAIIIDEEAATPALLKLLEWLTGIARAG
jgi:hypothetical protein